MRRAHGRIPRRAIPLLLGLLALLAPHQLQAAWLSDSRELMGTRVSVELWSEDAAQDGI